MNMIILGVIMVVLGGVVPSWGETYEWTDGKGVVNFTDDLDKVPVKYRGKVKTRESIQNGQATEPAPSAAQPEPRIAPSPAPVTMVYGGHGEGWWRGEYASLRQGIKAIEKSLAEKREKLAEVKRKRIIYQRTRDRIAYNQLEEEIKNEEAQLKEVQERLDALDSDAARYGVPPGWRQ